MKTLKKIVIGIVLLFLFSSLTKNLFDYRKKVQFYQDYKKEFESENKKNITLQTEIIKKSDPNEVEKTIRNRLNLSKPNEMVVIIPPLTPTPYTLTPTPLPNWQKWVNTFFKN